MLKTKKKIKMTLLLQFDRNELLIVKEWGDGEGKDQGIISSSQCPKVNCTVNQYEMKSPYSSMNKRESS